MQMEKVTSWGRYGWMGLVLLSLAACGGGAGSEHKTGSGTTPPAPAVVVVSPADGSTDVPGNKIVTATLDKAIDCSTATAGAFQLLHGGNPVAGEVACAGNTLTLTPAEPLAPEMAIEARVTTAIQSTDGAALAADYVWSFTTVGRTWGSAQRLELAAGEAWNPVAAADTAGNVMAVWRQKVGTNTNYSAFANRYTAEGGWGEPALLSTPGGDVLESVVATAPDGDVIAVWSEYDNSVWFNRYVAANDTWSGPQAIVTGEASTLKNIQLRIDDEGNALAVWHGWASTNEIRAIRYVKADDAWEASAQTLRNGEIDDLQLAMAANGDAMVTWTEYNGTVDDVVVRRYDSSSDAWGNPSVFNASPDSYTEAPAIAMDVAGNGMLVWIQDTYDSVTHALTYRLWSTRYDVAVDDWSVAEPVGSPVIDLYRPQLVLDGSGNATVVTDGAYGDTWTADVGAWRYLAATGEWSTVTVLDSGVGSAYDAKLVADAHGNVTVVWYQNEGGVDRIFANRFVVAQESWSTAQRISEVVSETGGGAFGPRLAVAPDGSVTAVWTQYDGNPGATVTSIWAGRLE